MQPHWTSLTVEGEVNHHHLRKNRGDGPGRNLPLHHRMARVLGIVNHHRHSVLVLGVVCMLVANSSVIVKLMNPTNSAVCIPVNTTVAYAHEYEDIRDFSGSEPDLSDFNISSLFDKTSPDDDDQYVTLAQDMGINLATSDLSEVQQRELLILIGKNRDVFATDLSELGETNLYHHNIDTGSAPPQRQRFYRTTPKIKDEIEKQVNDMLQNGIIEPSISEWQSPVVLVKKKDGSYRFAVDYRKLNSVTRPMHFPLPLLEDVFDAVGESEAQIFSVLDLFSGFWQVPMDPDSKHKAAFVTHHGVYQWKKLPFGLMNAPASFQLVMAEVLRGLNWKHALVYVDDILILSKNFQDHLDHLQDVFHRLRTANMRLKPSKCDFAAQKVTYLGHVITKDGFRLIPLKLRPFLNFLVLGMSLLYEVSLAFVIITVDSYTVLPKLLPH
ncbi:Retrovirus-related Pol polyprotein from transposon [Apostichopus japonicus]|uniref:Retrovirus-related Pol polyprotein from transposon n=1 Tax=Stichopus japonicus TaxID=307972 RepID=A0A2G8JDI3_STIJA|nr:Retrovirus-related Pol polyprotein from transposon [Apostichopus japonicus]